MQTQMSKKEKQLRDEFEEFVEECHVNTQVEPRLLPEGKVWNFLNQALQQQRESLIKEIEKRKPKNTLTEWQKGADEACEIILKDLRTQPKENE